MKSRLLPLLLLTSPLFLNACLDSSTGNNSTQNDTVEQTVSIPFLAYSDAKAIDCDSNMDSLGSTASSGSYTDLRYFIHAPVLIADNGDEYPLSLTQNNWQHKNVALLSSNGTGNCMPDSSSNMSITGSFSAPEDVSITSLRFGVGVPFELNHEDPTAAASPLNIAAMQWNWQGGYKHMRIEATVNDKAFIFHLGSVGCDGDPLTGGTTACNVDNRPVITIENFDTELSAIKFDFSELVTEVDFSSNQSCHSMAMQAVCETLLDQLGLDFYNGAGETIDQTQPGQTVFSSILNPS